MAANNMIVLIGRAGKDPEVKYFDNGKAVTRFTLAVDRGGQKDAQGNKITDWFSVDIWNRQGELAGDLIKKGTQVSVSGTLHLEDWTDRDGNKRTMAKVKADGFYLLSSKSDQQQHSAAAESGSSDKVVSFNAPRPAAAAAAPAASGGFDEQFMDEDDMPPF